MPDQFGNDVPDDLGFTEFVGVIVDDTLFNLDNIGGNGAMGYGHFDETIHVEGSPFEWFDGGEITSAPSEQRSVTTFTGGYAGGFGGQAAPADLFAATPRHRLREDATAPSVVDGVIGGGDIIDTTPPEEFAMSDPFAVSPYDEADDARRRDEEIVIAGGAIVGFGGDDLLI
jgi:hypothetical protein